MKKIFGRTILALLCLISANQSSSFMRLARVATKPLIFATRIIPVVPQKIAQNAKNMRFITPIGGLAKLSSGIALTGLSMLTLGKVAYAEEDLTGPLRFHQALRKYYGPNLSTLLKFLDNQGFDVNAFDNKGRSPLVYAIKSNPTAVPQILELQKVNVNLVHPQFKNQTPLHFAVGRSSDATQFLLEKGAKANVQDSDGNTPLHLALQMDRVETAAFLILKGNANFGIVNNAGLRADQGISIETLNKLSHEIELVKAKLAAQAAKK